MRWVQLTLAASIIADQAGNALAAPFSFQFNVRPASDVRAASGTAAIDRAPSANAGQIVGFRIPGASASSRITFTTTNGSGIVATRQVAPVFIDTNTQIAYFTVPVDATTGDVTIQGDPDGPFPLQIVPTLSLVDFTSLAVDGSTAGVRLRGTGFVEGANSRYVFGATTMLDASPFSGPDVFAGYVHENDAVNLTLDTSGDYRGAVRVTTNGGTSAPYSLGYTQLTSVAASGTPANAALASANPGQLVTLAGSGFSLATDVIGTWYDYSVGAVQRQLLAANFVDATGTQLTVPIPNHFSGAFALEVVGSAFAPTLQIVPVVDALALTGVGALRIRGRGFVEGNNSQYTLTGGTVTDADGTSGPNVFWGFVHPGDGVDLTLPAHGVGNFTVTTSGGTSAPLSANFLHPAAGDLRDVAFDGTNLWVATAAGQVRKIAAATGATLATWPIPGGGASGTGLAVLTSPMTLAGVAVPAGHLLVSSWNFAPDRIMAINPADGAVVATLNLAENLDIIAMQYDPSGGGHLYVLDTSPDEVVEIDPATGARIRAFATTLPAGGQDAGGLAFHPVTGNLWIGTSNTPLVAELNPTTGALVRQVDLAPFGLANDISGLAFDNNLRLLVSSYRTATVHSIDLAANLTLPPPTITGITSVARDGTPHVPGTASANVAQTIELVGTNFTLTTPFLFPTRDAAGSLGTAIATPTAVSADRTRAQVIVPDLAQTGAVTLSSSSARSELGFWTSYPDAIYRNLSERFTPGGATTTLHFSDGGLEGLGNESWGLDNVRVRRVSDGQIVFSDDFEAGAKPQWSSSTTDNSYPATFSQFSGRFSNQVQTLQLPVTAGQEYELLFDLYIIDSWDGSSTSAGPDYFNVLADGAVLFQETFSNVGNAQSYLGYDPGSVALQIVPVLAGISGRPGVDATFDLLGSGFMEGASTLRIGGVTWVDNYASSVHGDAFGARNDTYRFVSRFTTEGPIRIETAGGFHQINAPAPSAPAFVQFDAIMATAATGAAAGAASASANAGQNIVLSGQGFTTSTLVQFTAVDSQGTVGVLTRTGTPNPSGTQLTVRVPALARTGQVRVVGDDAAVLLEVVPTLRSVGGGIAVGNTITLEGSGFAAGDLVVSIDGRQVGGVLAPRMVSDQGLVQQVLDVTVPTGVANQVVTVTTSGGSFTLLANASVTALANLNPADAGDTIAAAAAVNLPENRRVTIAQTIGDNGFAGQDVDLYQVTGVAGDVFTLDAARQSANSLYLRLFDAAGVQLVADGFSGPNSSPRVANFRLPATGTYYVGVSGWSNTTYNPNTANSGANGATGNYALTLQRVGAGSTSLAGVTAAATSGTPRIASIPSALVGQTITLSGSGLLTGERIVFTTSDDGPFGTVVATAATVAGDGTSLTVVVPTNATTGMVRLERENVGRLLQIVPTLVDVDNGANEAFHNQSLRLRGTGFVEGGIEVRFGNQAHQDLSTDGSFNVGAYFVHANDGLDAQVPDGVASGPITVRTLGGTSAAFGLTFTGIASTATSGTPANAAFDSANPGQSIVLEGTGFDASTDVVFPLRGSNGAVSERVVRPIAVNPAGTQLTVIVPLEATTGDLRVVGDQTGASVPLQIVPTLSLVDFTSLAVDGSTAGVRLRGTGFVEGANSRYVFGATTMLDASPFSGPDVFAGYVHENDAVNLTLDTSGDYRGAVRVTTNGGTSAPYSLGYTQLTSVAASGTPANAALASANPGQLVTLAGSGFSLATDVIGTWYDYSVGAVQRQLLAANFVDATGTQLTVPIPNHFSGAFALEVVGSAFAPTLQIVPVVDALALTGVGALRIRGRGFVEGNNSQYTLTGGTVTDADGTSGPNVFWGFVHPGDGVDLTLPAHGVGNFTVTTSGGTSAPLSANFLHPAAGDLRDVAFDGTNLWVATAAGQVRKIAAATGATLATWPIPGGGASGTGLAVLTSPMTLAGVAVPAGHLLVSSWNFAPDRIMAINPADGAVVATLNLAENLDIIAMQYDPSGGGHLYVLDTSPDEVVEIDPATGARIRAFATTLPAGGQDAGGLAFHPVTGNLWIGTSNTPLVAELNPTTGALVRQVDLAPFGLANDISGLAFDNNLRLLVSSYRTATVHSIDLAAPAPPMAPAALVDAAMRVDRFRAPPVRIAEERLVAGRMRMHYVQRVDAVLEQLDRQMEMPHVRRLAADARVVRRSGGEDQLGAGE